MKTKPDLPGSYTTEERGGLANIWCSQIPHFEFDLRASSGDLRVGESDLPGELQSDNPLRCGALIGHARSPWALRSLIDECLGLLAQLKGVSVSLLPTRSKSSCILDCKSGSTFKRLSASKAPWTNVGVFGKPSQWAFGQMLAMGKLKDQH